MNDINMIYIYYYSTLKIIVRITCLFLLNILPTACDTAMDMYVRISLIDSSDGHWDCLRLLVSTARLVFLTLSFRGCGLDCCGLEHFDLIVIVQTHSLLFTHYIDSIFPSGL